MTTTAAAERIVKRWDEFGECYPQGTSSESAEVARAYLALVRPDDATPVEQSNPFDRLTLTALTFLSERTDFSEPWCGFGFATAMREEIAEALERKQLADQGATQ